MARKKVFGVATNVNGSDLLLVMPLATVTCFRAGTATAINMYAAEVGGSPAVIKTDAEGHFEFWVEIVDNNKIIKVVAILAGYVTVTEDDIFLMDSTEVFSWDSSVSASTDVAANTVHRGSSGVNHADVVSNNTHRGSDGKNHSDVGANNAKRHEQGHAFAGADHSASNLASVNSKISDASLIDTADARLSDARTPTAHNFGGGEHTADSLANLNSKVSDGTLIDTADARLKKRYDAIVAPALGDYTTVGAALTGEAEGAIIGIVPGAAYDESGADLTFKEGQIVEGLGGVEGDDQNSVICSMGDSIIDINVTEMQMRGIYFKFAPTTDEAKLDIAAGADDCVIEKCVLDFTAGGAAHSGIFDAGDRTRVRDVKILNNANSYRAVTLSGAIGSIYERIYITGGEVNTGTMFYTTVGSDCRFTDIWVVDPDAGAANDLININPSRSVVTGAFADVNGVGTIRGIRISGQNVSVTDCVAKDTTGDGIFVTGDYCVLKGCMTEGCVNGFEVNSGTNTRMIGCTTKSTITRAFTLSGVSPNSSIEDCDFDAGSVRSDTDANSPNMRMSNTYFAGDFRIQQSNCLLVNNEIVGTLTITAGADRTRLSNNLIGTLADGGAFTKFGAMVHRSAAADPTVNEDVADGFEVGHFWINETTPALFVCFDNSAGAADWNAVTTT